MPWKKVNIFVLTIQLGFRTVVRVTKKNTQMEKEMSNITTSGDTAALFKALAKAQSEMGGAVKGDRNPFFKSSYASLTSVLRAVGAPLAKNGLSLVQMPGWDHDNNMPTLTTMLCHEEGGYVQSTASAPFTKGKTGPQEYGSVISYLRRYSLQAVLAVPSVDDDAEATQMIVRQEVEEELPKKKPSKKKPSKKEVSVDTTAPVEVEVAPACEQGEQGEQNELFACVRRELETAPKTGSAREASKKLATAANKVAKYHKAGRVTDAQRTDLVDVYLKSKSVITKRLKSEIQL
jgi:hypothetical protein